VTDSAGLAGLLQVGDRVGVTAVLLNSGETYAKVVYEGLRVLYVSPEFRSLDPAVYQPVDSESGGFNGGGSVPDRENKGVIVLAVPTNAVVIAYDFTAFGVDSEVRTVNVIDLLPALDHANNIGLSLFIQPDEAEAFVTSGVNVADLAITPGPSATPAPGSNNAAGFNGDVIPEYTPFPSLDYGN
jgi:hypothetical protein